MNANDNTRSVHIYMMRGLPRSGKSTVAKTVAKKQRCPIVSRDAIRLSVHGQSFVEVTEPLIGYLCACTIRSLVYAGHHEIVLDECHIDKERAIESLKRTFNSTKLTFTYEWVEVNTPESKCIERAIECGQDYLVPVIKNMGESY